MKYEVYTNLRVNDDFSVFDFVSTGKRGAIPKRILFTETEWGNVYNLAFGDVGDDGEIDDHSNSGNGDRNNVLATVAKVVRDYTQRYPDRWLLFSGSTPGRTRLYRMAIGLHFEELSKQFEIYADVGGNIVPFTRDLEIEYFLVKRKMFKFGL